MICGGCAGGPLVLSDAFACADCANTRPYSSSRKPRRGALLIATRRKLPRQDPQRKAARFQCELAADPYRKQLPTLLSSVSV